MKEFAYKIVYDTDKKTGIITATIPELSHVSSFGTTFAEAETNVREAALGYIEALRMLRQAPPKPVFASDGTYLRLLVPA